MLRNVIRISLVLPVLLACSAALAQVDFSADLVNLSASNTFPTKVFATQDKLRFQGQDRSGRTNSIMIVDLAAGTSIVLMPQQHLYVQENRPQIPGQGVTFFQPKDVEDACGEWQKMAHAGKDKCRKVGHEAANGRDAVKYERTSAKGDVNDVWIDAVLRFPVKWKSSAGVGELRNIKTDPQPAELFEIPPGYTRRTFATAPKPKSAQP
jgi:hypothetical protein